MQEDKDGKGAVSVAEALQKNSTLTQLNFLTLSSGNTGALAMAKALTVNTTLTDLTYFSLFSFITSSGCHSFSLL